MSRSLIIMSVLALFTAAAWCCKALAHESQPGLLELRQLGENRYEVIWRAPIYYGKPHPAKLQLPEDWMTVGQPTVRQLSSAFMSK